MVVEVGLIEKRKEIKSRLADDEYKTLVDVAFAWINRTIQKISRQSKPFSLSLLTVIISFLVVVISLALTFIAGDQTNFTILAISFGFGVEYGYLLVISIVILTISTVFVINQSLKRVILLWRDKLLDNTESIESLCGFEDWLDKVCNSRSHLLVTIIGGLLVGYFIVLLLDTQLESFVGYGISISSIVISMFLAAYGYQFLMAILLPILLRRYDLRLFSADPATSEVLSRLSGELSFFVYFVAVYAALVTLATISQGILQDYGIVVVLILWLPIIAMFILNQSSLSSVVRRAKWKSLNEIQAKVEKLQSTENFETKDTMDAINRLLDYHERINKTRFSALDFRAYLNFINSLLLPLLAFVLGNLDKLTNLFSKP